MAEWQVIPRGQIPGQNPLNPLNPVNIFVFDGTITKPIWPMSSINFYKMNLLLTSHSPQVSLVDYRNLNLWRDSNPIDFFFSQMRPAKVSNVTKLSSRHAVHIFRNSSWTILVSIPLSFSGRCLFPFPANSENDHVGEKIVKRHHLI